MVGGTHGKWATHLKFSTCVAPHKCGAFLCLQVQLCDAKMRKGCYELVLGMVKNEF